MKHKTKTQFWCTKHEKEQALLVFVLKSTISHNNDIPSKEVINELSKIRHFIYDSLLIEYNCIDWLILDQDNP